MVVAVGNAKTIFPNCRTLYKGKRSIPLEKGEVNNLFGGILYVGCHLL